MIIKLTNLALSDLKEIQNYIKKDSPYYAIIFIKRIINSIKKLKDFPEIGRIVPEYNKKDIREIIFNPYRIIYKIQNDIVYVVTVIHGSRLLEKHVKNI